MSTMNRRRVVVGGLVAGGILVLLDLLVSPPAIRAYVAAHPHAVSPVLAASGNAARVAVVAAAKDVLWGFAIVWCYAAIRPRFGPGPRTATYAAVLAWVIALPMYVLNYAFGIASFGFTCIVGVTALLSFLIAGYVGGMLYREQGATTG